MRKKSHISLAKFLVNNMQVDDLKEHKKAFYLGSILPDIKPSFLTRRHTFDETFEILIDEIKKITVDYDINQGINGYYARHLGVITHYLSDYCTYPHNSIFEGSMTEHIHYERDLKHSLKEYVEREETQRGRKHSKKCTLDEIVHIIYRTHREYLKALKDVQEDIQYIIELCCKVVDAILTFLEMALAQLHNKDIIFA
jgi:CRISPR/Cas system-associated endoribonuclease Cas2